MFENVTLPVYIGRDAGLAGLEGDEATGVRLTGTGFAGETDRRLGARTKESSQSLVIWETGSPKEKESLNDAAVGERRGFRFSCGWSMNVPVGGATPIGEPGRNRDEIGDGVLVTFKPVGLLATGG